MNELFKINIQNHAIGAKEQEYLDLLEGSVQELFALTQKNKIDYVGKFFGVDTIKEERYTELGIGQLGEMETWNGSIPYEEFNKGYSKTFVQVKYAKGITYPLEFATLYGRSKRKEIVNGAARLTQTAYNTQQTHAAKPFNDGFTTEYSTPDGKALFATDHTSTPNDSYPQQNLFIQTELTPANLSKVRNAMYQFKDDKGNLLGLNPRVIIVGDYYLDNAKKICGSEKEPFTAENDMNVHEEMTYIHCPRIQGKKWFLVDADEMKMYNRWIWAKKPSIAQTVDFDSELLKYKITGLWTFGATSWHWICGCTND
jgi:hypothetical protein